MTPSDIAYEMEQVLTHLDGLVVDMREAGAKLAITERDYKVGFARSRMKVRAGGERATVDAVNDQATVENSDELFAYTVAQQHLTVTREALRAAESRLDALRSMGAAIRGAGG